MKNPTTRLRLRSAMGCQVFLLVTIGMGLWLIRSISRPSQEAVRILNAISKGDLMQKIVATSQDETGKLLTALAEMTASSPNICRLGPCWRQYHRYGDW